MQGTCKRGKMKKKDHQVMVSRDIVKHKEEIKIHAYVKALGNNKLLLLNY